MITRRRLVALLTTVLAAPRPARASDRRFRIGVLVNTPTDAAEPAQVRVWDAFVDELARLGYSEGRQVAFERRVIAPHEGAAAAATAELLRANVDVLVVANTTIARAAKQATSTVPIVIVGVTDPDRTGLVAGLARPGGNVTGVARPNVGAKRLEFLKQIAPRTARVAVVWMPDNPASALGKDDLAPHARALGMTLLSVPVRTEGDVAPGLEKARREGAQAFYLHDVVIRHRDPIMSFALAHRLPTAGSSPRWAVYGALFAYGPSSVHIFRRAAAYVDRILRGTRPADLPIEQPQVYELVVNVKTAKAIGVAVPRPLLMRADQVIE